MDPGAVSRHHVRSIEEPRDLPEPLRFALRAEIARRCVEPFEGLVRGGPERDLGVEHEFVRGVADGQRLGRDLDAVSRHRLAIDAHRAGIECPTVEDQVRRVRGGGIAPDPERRPHQGLFFAELEIEIHRVDDEWGRGVVFEARDGGFGRGHL